MKVNRSVQQLYTKRASRYDRLFVDFLGWGKELKRFFQKSNDLHPNSKVLDAGCGTGIITRVLYQLAEDKHYQDIQFHGFDLTQGMLDVFQQWIAANHADSIELRQADVLELMRLPAHWSDYDLIVSSTMLEHLPPEQVKGALANLGGLLKPNGTLLVFVTRRNLLTRWVARLWWKTNVYVEHEIRRCFQELGFENIESRKLSAGWSNSIMVVEAKK
jgi:ubiquinone/menaquinone biosynthesis C-methylase UbiE